MSVIVPAFNESARIDACLQSLLAQDYPAELLQLIVVDNGSTDDTHARLSANPRLLVLRETAPGSYAARNLGLAHARGEFVCFTDADCTVAPDWVRMALRGAVHECVGVVAGRVALECPMASSRNGAVNFELLFAFRQEDNARRNRSVTANWCSPTQVLRAAGGFDASLRSGGDWELAERIAAAGWRVVYASEMIVHHPARGSLIELVRKKRRQAGGMFARDFLSGKRSFARLLWLHAKELFVRGRRVVRCSELRVSERIGVLGVVMLLFPVAQIELLRLRLGAQAQR